MSDKKQYLLTYFWSILEYLTYFLSLFLVTPKITGLLSTAVYGVYITVIAYTTFLNYFDFGFLGAANKFGCDEYIKGNKKKEVEILATVSFIQIITFSVFAMAMVLFSLYPDIIINHLNEETRRISRYLFLMLAIFVFGFIPKRIITFIAQFRIQIYQVSSWFIITNLVNIGLIYFIFTNNDSINIIYYYLISNSVSLIITLCLGVYLFKKWNYSLRGFLKNMKINRPVLKYLWPFAKVSLFSSIMYMLYFELDTVYISKFISPDKVAIYILGFNLMGFYRRISSTLNSPYVPKYNGYYVNNDDIGMNKFYLSNLSVVIPFIIIPVVVNIVLMPQFITAWVGGKFVDSIVIAQILFCGYLFAPFADISSYVITAKLKINIMYISSTLVTVIFWTIVICFTGNYGIVAVAYAKAISMIFSVIYTVYVCHKINKINFLEFCKKIIFPIILAAVVVVILALPFRSIVTYKAKIELLKILLIEGVICFIGISFYIYISKNFRIAVGEDYFTYNKMKNQVVSFVRNMF